jgi:hypothetical protein
MLVVTKLDLCRGISDLPQIMTMFHQANDHCMNWRPRGRPGRITGGCCTRHATNVQAGITTTLLASWCATMTCTSMTLNRNLLTLFDIADSQQEYTPIVG